MSKYPFKRKSESELVREKLKEFYRVEEICGKGNVRDKCRYGFCSSELGLTCYYWRKAAFEAEQKEDD